MKIFTLFTILFLSAFAVFSQGYYYEYKISSGTNSGILSYSCQDGNIRSVLRIGIPGSDSEEIAIGRLLLKDNPDMLYQLDSASKTFAEVDISSHSDWKDYAKSDYTVQVAGKDTINGYHTTHVVVTWPNNKQQTDMWLTTEIPYYNELIKYKSPITAKRNMYAALKAKGVSGFPVKIITWGDEEQLTLQLSEVKERAFSKSMYSLAGYSKLLSVKEQSSLDILQLMSNKMLENTGTK